MGPIEFEAEGDSDIIEREREKFFSLLPQAITAVSSVVAKPSQIIEAASRIEDVEESNNSNSVLPNMKELPSNIDISIANFLNEKKFGMQVEEVMGVAYFIDIVEKNGPFTSKDIEDKLMDARHDKPSNISQYINMNIKKGFLRECSEKKGNLKTFSVLDKGIQWCESYISKQKNQTKKVNKSKHVVIDSKLLSIPINELNLDRYCDVANLEKFNEQMLVVMLMYTNEKDIDYFSYNDIVSVFKNKFKISTTRRKVRYAFDSGRTMFDKIVDKGIVCHKLMSSGIKEAERIVAAQKTAILQKEKKIN
jgi:hypothetical protein